MKNINENVVKMEGIMKNNEKITNDELKKASEIVLKIKRYYYSKMVGQYDLGNALLIGLMTGGHVLVESVPGLAKTTAAKTMTEAVDGTFARVQCTPDLLPSDIVGIQMFNAKTGEFETKLGPVHANFVLLDEINRSSAKTQSAMLEVMEEHQTSIGNETYAVPEVFMVIATQNPIEQEGTYLLSEAQMDRFLLKSVLSYPSEEEELEVLNRIENDVFSATEKVASLDEIKYLMELTKRIYIDDSIKKYIVSLVNATRNPYKFIGPKLANYITIGASIRGAIGLMEVSKAIALLDGRDYVTPDDVKKEVHSVLRHRIGLNYAALADGVTSDEIIDAIIGAVGTP